MMGIYSAFTDWFRYHEKIQSINIYFDSPNNAVYRIVNAYASLPLYFCKRYVKKAMEENKITLNYLQQLAVLLNDSMHGFGKIAERSVSDRYKSLMEEYKNVSSHLLNDLQDEIVELGGEPAGTLENMINNLWLNLKPTLLQIDIKNILKNVLKCEESYIRHYDEVLNIPALPSRLSERLKQHKASLTERLMDIRNLVRVAEL